MDPKTLRYSASHEWASLDGDVCTVGITKFAVEQLTDIVYIELKAGKLVAAGEPFGEVESVKSVNDLYSPVNGDIVEVNSQLDNDPSLVSKDPYGKGWLIKVKVAAGATLDDLLTHEQYQEQLASEEH